MKTDKIRVMSPSTFYIGEMLVNSKAKTDKNKKKIQFQNGVRITQFPQPYAFQTTFLLLHKNESIFIDKQGTLQGDINLG